MIHRNLIFIDSFQFIKHSLSDLANNLPKDGFYHTKMSLAVYPYDYMDDFNKFKEEGLPSMKRFYSKSTSENINDYDYNHAKNV